MAKIDGKNHAHHSLNVIWMLRRDGKLQAYHKYTVYVDVIQATLHSFKRSSFHTRPKCTCTTTLRGGTHKQTEKWRQANTKPLTRVGRAEWWLYILHSSNIQRRYVCESSNIREIDIYEGTFAQRFALFNSFKVLWSFFFFGESNETDDERRFFLLSFKCNERKMFFCKMNCFNSKKLCEHRKMKKIFYFWLKIWKICLKTFI